MWKLRAASAAPQARCLFAASTILLWGKIPRAFGAGVGPIMDATDERISKSPKLAIDLYRLIC